MTRPFTPRDALRLRALQAVGVNLELEDAVLDGRSSLRRALQTWGWPGGERFDTLVLAGPGDRPASGFIQCRRGPDRAADASLVFVSPALSAVEGAAILWQRLAAGACQWLGAHGVARVLTTVPEDDPVALQAMRQLGFNVLTNDTVFVCPIDQPAPEPPAGVVTVPLADEHAYAVGAHALRALPETERADASPAGGDWASSAAHRRAGCPLRSRVWLGAMGDVRGAWQAAIGPAATWLWVVPGTGDDAGALVRSAVADLASGPHGRRPIYASARGHEADLNVALRERGFAPVLRRFRLVKHTTARVLAPAWRARGAGRGDLRRVPSSSVRVPAVRIAGDGGTPVGLPPQSAWRHPDRPARAGAPR